MANRNQDDNGTYDHTETATGVHGSPNPQQTPGQSSASDWDMDRTKPSGERGRKKGGSENTPRQQAPQNGNT